MIQVLRRNRFQLFVLGQLVSAVCFFSESRSKNLVYDPVSDITDWFSGAIGRENLPQPWSVIVTQGKTLSQTQGDCHNTAGGNGLPLRNGRVVDGSLGSVGLAQHDGLEGTANGWIQPGDLGS